MENDAALLLALLLDEDGMSIHKACKRLGWSMSEMMRRLTALGPTLLGGLDLVAQRQDAGRTRLFLTPRGHAACAGMGAAENSETRMNDETGSALEQ